MIRDLNHRLGWVFPALVCLSVVIWSLVPAKNHVPALIDTLQEQVQMITEHGHAHGLEEDLAWALHGHSHDAADHDHGSAVILPAQMPLTTLDMSLLSAVEADTLTKALVFQRKRPPRV